MPSLSAEEERDELARMIEPDAFNPESKRYWNVPPDSVDHIRSNALVRADKIREAGYHKSLSDPELMMLLHERDRIIAGLSQKLPEDEVRAIVKIATGAQS